MQPGSDDLAVDGRRSRDRDASRAHEAPVEAGIGLTPESPVTGEPRKPHQRGQAQALGRIAPGV